MCARQARYNTLLLLSILAATFLSSCKEGIVSASAPLSVHISGTVLDANTLTPLGNASVVLTVGSTKDSVLTKTDGTFEFIIDVPDSAKGANITLTVYETGYLTQTITANVKSDQSFQVGLNVNLSTYAIVTGAVRDSASSYPLRSASVLISLPGLVDSATTLQDGSFAINVDLENLNSIAATMTVTKTGFKTYRGTVTLKKGVDTLGTILLPVDQSSAYAHIVGHVTDSRSGQPLTNASVFLSSTIATDSTKTLGDGSYSFDLNLQGPSSVSGTLLFRLSGFRDTTISFSVNVGQTATEDVALITSLNYAIVTGTVRDSASQLPLQGANVLISLPGSVASMTKLRGFTKTHAHSVSSLVLDSTTTLADGSFSMAINLVDLNSISATMIVSKTGFVTYQSVRTFQEGTNALGSIFIKIDNSSSVAHLVGNVTDSRTGLSIPNVSVLLSSPLKVDSTKTLNDGSYSFDVDLKGLSSTSVTLLFRLSGYNDMTINFSANAGQTTTENVLLTPQSSATYANVTGVVRDSASGYPLGGVSVLISLPGSSSSTIKLLSHNIKSNRKSVSSLIVDSTTTQGDGSFAMNVNLYDLDSISATMTVSKAGFVTYQTVQTFQKGANNLGSIFIKIDNSMSIAHLVGYVTDSKSIMPITGVSVYLTSPIKSDSTKTLNDGSYSFAEDLKGLTSFSGTLLFRLNSYNDTTVQFTANAGQTLTENVALSAKATVVGGDSSTGRGIARSIALISVSHQEISVHGVGGNETSVLVWQVLDSLGFPIDILHRDTVTFVPTGIPVMSGDPAYVTPTLVLTDGSGEASTTVNSGTVAGTIQLTAKLRLASGAIVQSSPVLITVDGGLPDQAHFSLNSNPPHAANFAGYDWSEVTQGFTVQAGDKYANPVHQSTAIYFSTTAGIITAAGQTDATGHADATLYSGYPLPSQPPSLLSSFLGIPSSSFGDGTGYAFVKAFTQGENGVTIADSDVICISASAGPILLNNSTSIPPVTIVDSQVVSIQVHISDRFGNPLESGTSVTTTVNLPPPPPGGGGTVWSIIASGLNSVSGGPLVLGDNLVRGSGSTDFTLLLSASLTQGTLPASTSFTVTISVQGRNTNNEPFSTTFSGVAIAQ